MPKQNNPSLINMVLESEFIENLKLDSKNVKTNSEELTKNINRETVSAFLDCPGTVLNVVKLEDGNYSLIAKNSISNETVKVDCLGDHFYTLINVIEKATEFLQNSNQNKQQLLTHEFIKDINLSLQKVREGEIAIGEYRNLDFRGRPVEVHIGDGQKALKCYQLETSRYNNIQIKMDQLLNWVNSEEFKNPDNLYENIAKFHANFIKIHPFRDGNGRTARLLTNYLLLTSGLKMINITDDIKLEYTLAINYALSDSNESFINESPEYAEYYKEISKVQGERTEENKYSPLVKLLKSCEIASTNELIKEIMNYKNRENDKEIIAEQI